jgi:signal transduction histidine kinase
VLGVLLALALSLALEPVLGTRTRTFFLAVAVFSALYGGIGPALLATALGALALDLWAITPGRAFDLQTVDQIAQLAVFVLVGVATGLTSARLRAVARARDRELRARARTEAEQRLVQANHQLETALADLRRSQRRVVEQERLQAVGQMASGIAHDFNNALAMILGHTELLLATPEVTRDPAQVRTHAQQINEVAQDAAAVVARLAAVYRGGSGPETFEPVNLNDLVAQAISLTQPRWRDEALARGITIAIRTTPGEIPPIRGNAPSLRELLVNLLFNAVDALPEGGTITVGTRAEGDRVVLTVADDGVGMSEEVRRQCLDPFFSTKGERGSGLGLSMVRDIVARHEGEIDIDSAPGQGTTLAIALPTAPPGTEPVVEPPGVERRTLRILLVDDEPRLRQILASYLAIDGHRVTPAADGAEALRHFEPGRFDLVITDRAMPELGGDALAAAIEELAPDLPLIMLTGFATQMEQSEEHLPGVDLVLSKPVTLRRLREAIVTVLPTGR